MRVFYESWVMSVGLFVVIFCFKQKTAYEMRISDWSSDVCSSDLAAFDASWRLALAVGSVMALVTLAGHYGVLSGYDLSADEQLANFDAAILAKGQLVAPLPPMWWDHADEIGRASGRERVCQYV